MHRIHTSSLSLVLAALATALPATAADQATAEALFQDGKRLAAAGDFARACPKFAESQRLDPASGTALNLADCLEKVRKYASAWAAFKDAEAGARAKGNKEREAEAARRAAALAPRLSKLTIVVPPASKVPGFELRRDGSVVGEAQWGSALPVDQGHHEIVASAAGYKPWTTSVRIDTDGGAASVEVPPLEKQPDATTWTGQRIAGIALGSVGVVGVAVGGILGGVALSKNSASKQDCSPTNPNSCTAAGVSLRSTSITMGNASTAAMAIGGALVATGIVLVVIGAPAKKAEGARVEVLPGVGALALRGRF